MTKSFENIRTIIKERRSIFPRQYNQEEIPASLIAEILELANWAPTHKKTEPWRFIVYQGKGLETLSTQLGEAYKTQFTGDRFSELKFKKTVEKPLKSAAVIAICMQRDPKESLPEWEEIAATACAVQNMWLCCTSLGIGSYWSSPGIVTGANGFMDLNEGERCLGLFYMGYWEKENIHGKRSPVDDKIRWINN